jgi:hypothetical protein
MLTSVYDANYQYQISLKLLRQKGVKLNLTERRAK